MDIFGNASNVILTVAALLAVIGAAFKFFTPQMRKALGIVDLVDEDDEELILPKDVAAKVDAVLANQSIFTDVLAHLVSEILPPDSEQIQDALKVLHRAGLVDADAEEDSP
jgi:hypothetical protein